MLHIQVCDPIYHIDHLPLLLAMLSAECARRLEEVCPSELSAQSPHMSPVKMPCQAHWYVSGAILPQCLDQGALSEAHSIFLQTDLRIISLQKIYAEDSAHSS